ncbi:hypothetical protein GO755_13745 [Spirosoma sp. HMF4905]|uniref:HPt domain-containing protein n=1 Tax=Spirosoma arboris TaxID=2682092 RepID=A0A7K1SBC7_9BACT|nr:Hpt domain-containing protein [Spirosoma arboris]MVM31099.1 hypothetical protein [Spirosoma arboris]
MNNIDASLTQRDQNEIAMQLRSRLVNTPIYSLDLDRLNELYGDDTEYAVTMFETFLEEVLPEFSDFDSLIQQHRWEEVRQLAHKLRPTLGMVGLTDLETLLAQFEELIIMKAESQRIHRHWYLFQSDLQSCKPLVQTEWQRLLTINKL